MATLLYRLGRASFRRRKAVGVLWLVLLAAVGTAALTLRGETGNNFTMPGTESQRAIDALQHEFPEASGATGVIVVSAPAGRTLQDPTVANQVVGLVKEAGALPGVLAAVDPYQAKAFSPDMRTALINVQFKERADQITEDEKDAFLTSGVAAEQAGFQVEHGGEILGAPPEVGGTEAIGVVIALIVLLVTLGSLVAAGMTMLNALIGVGAGMAGLFALSGVIELTSTAPVLALMLGLAVGIDYSLFITSRHRQNLVEGLEPEEAAGRAVGTAGSAVLFAGVTVIIALAGLSVVNIPFLTVMGLAAAGTVAVAVLVALTLLPALLGFAGLRILPRKLRGAGRHEASAVAAATKEGFGFRWARMVIKLRVPVIIVGILGLGALTLPAPDMRLALPAPGSSAEGSPARLAADVITERFGPGFNGRLALIVSSDSPETTAAAAGQVTTALRGTPNLLLVTPPNPSGDKKTMLLGLIPKDGPTSKSTENLVHEVRERTHNLGGADVSLTGQTAIGIDVSEKLSDAMPIYLLLVVGLSVLLLMLVFRSILVPVKAALGFLLTVGATFGITVFIFQQGHLADLVGLESPGPLVSFLPILLIGILFGLAMDYEVFLVSRMREDFVHGETPYHAVVSGTGHGARVVTAAALIMTSVFAGFVLIEDPIIKSMGFALAIGVAIDAFIVRMTIVPAVMSLLGRGAWWIPRWLDKVLPDVDIEGEKLRKQIDAPPPASSTADPEPVRV
ncbi:MMPL family transporter [Actinoplanes sp. NBRC 103695]|uniref:MMPL family transporter n=1 Tax=Actinoplanes sp. NBRC 103695 TaxID=3032202 RepID=UPI0024A4A324|nr:MMPL family transporter [Actinoplanes sp. NBRC 103695]GLZ01918.1 membrane protein [Actinoplanes sp. NBRC 103695]